MLQHAEDVCLAARVGVQFHVEQRELDLAQGLQAALEVLGGEHLVEQRARQRLAVLDMAAEGTHIPLPAEVLHELAGQLDGVPLDARDARGTEVVHLGEQVVQAVAELVEQGDDVVVRQQRGLVPDGDAQLQTSWATAVAVHRWA